MFEFLLIVWAVISVPVFLWTGPGVIKGIWNNDMELAALIIWPVLSALVPFLIILGFCVLGWEKITGKEVVG